MSATEILDTLPTLSLPELQQIQERIFDLENQQEIEPSAGLSAAIVAGLRSLEAEPTLDVVEILQKIAGWAGRSA